LTANLEYTKYDDENLIFTTKSNLSIAMGLGKRITAGLVETAGTSKQTYININAMHNFYLNKKNCFNINYQNYFLKSEKYIINELYRFGGIKSIRGFAENSLQASFMTAIITEYRYIISPDLYLHSILDYSYYQDDSTNNKDNLLGFGFGFGIQTKNGLLKIAFANGSSNDQEIKFNNTNITIGYNVKF
jgi:hemolysin activation/secretion protein